MLLDGIQERGDKTKNINVYKPPGKISDKILFIQFLNFPWYDFLAVYDFEYLSMFLCIVDIWECLELGSRRVGHVVEWYSCRDGSLRCLHPPRSDEVRGEANGGIVLTRIQGKSSKIKLFPQVVIHSCGIYTSINDSCFSTTHFEEDSND